MALLRRSSTRSSTSGLQEAAEKKRESRRSGFFNLIKSRTSRSEKSSGAAAITPPHSSSSSSAPPPPSTSCISPVMEEATQASPPPPQQELHPDPDHTHSVTEKAWPAGEAAEEKEVQQEGVEEEKNTHIRHLGVPVMGLDLLAEMKARQEKMAVKRVRRTPVHICSQQLLLVLLVESRHLIIIKH